MVNFTNIPSEYQLSKALEHDDWVSAVVNAAVMEGQQLSVEQEALYEEFLDV